MVEPTLHFGDQQWQALTRSHDEIQRLVWAAVYSYFRRAATDDERLELDMCGGCTEVKIHNIILKLSISDKGENKVIVVNGWDIVKIPGLIAYTNTKIDMASGPNVVFSSAVVKTIANNWTNEARRRLFEAVDKFNIEPERYDVEKICNDYYKINSKKFGLEGTIRLLGDNEVCIEAVDFVRMPAG